METRLRYAGQGRLAAATGWLAPPVLGRPAYPLVGAEPALAAVPQDPGRTREGVGARPGLTLRRDLGGRELLLPAWFYFLRDGSTLTALALDPLTCTRQHPGDSDELHPDRSGCSSFGVAKGD